ncbi:MAG: hypothetical protein AAB971_04285 [Patescibacteria group bacterium]|mgnify:CR=1 FL=1
MQQTLIILSGLLTIACVAPYIHDIIKRRTKPRIVSWLNWTLLTAIATAAAISGEHWSSAVLTGSATVATMAIVLLSLKYGNRKVEALDVVCQAGAIIGLVLWVMFSSPLIALVMSAFIDFIVGLPTYKHAWQKPFEETQLTFAIAALAALLGLIAVDKLSLPNLLFPVYLLLANLTLVGLIRFSPNRA